jgi:hypothetical protein
VTKIGLFHESKKQIRILPRLSKINTKYQKTKRFKKLSERDLRFDNFSYI